MPYCQSAEMPPDDASARSRSTICQRARISCGLVLCGCSHPAADQFAKLTFASHDEEFRLRHYVAKKMILRRQPATKFHAREEVGVDLAPETLAGGAEPGRDGAVRDFAHDHQVDVALGSLAGCGHRAEN